MQPKPPLILFGILLSFGLPVFAMAIISLFYPQNGQSYLESKFFFSRLLLWLCLLAMYAYAIKIEKQPFLLWKEKNYSPGFYLAAIVVVMLLLFVLVLFLGILFKLTGLSSHKSARFTQLIPVFRDNPLLMLFTILTAGIVEELVFRGYLQPRLHLFFKNSFLAIIISSVLFGFIHFGYGTFQNIAGPVFIGALFALFYYHYKNIKILIICHFLYDLLVILFALRFHAPPSLH